MATRYEPDFVAAVASESTAAFEKLLPSLPYIGGNQNPLTDNLVFSANALALYQAMKRHGKRVEEIGELLYRTVEVWTKRYPRFILRLMGWFYLTRLSQRQAKRKALVSQERRHTGDWEFVHVEGDGKPFEWGRDYVQSGIVIFLHSQGADELAPYICLIDYALFGALGLQLQRAMTLAEGCKKCDFRYRKGESPSGWPPPWVEKGRRNYR
jgi:hypothetical protein